MVDIPYNPKLWVLLTPNIKQCYVDTMSVKIKIKYNIIINKYI
jgi:hypothetical protein